VKSPLDRRSRQYPMRNRGCLNWLESTRRLNSRLRPILKIEYINEMKFGTKVTYSMEAWMKISRFTLNATDHTRGTGAISGSVPCALDCEELAEVVRAPVRNLSVVTTRLLRRSLNCDLTSNTCYRQRSIPETRKQAPETISAGTSLSSLRNKERHACSIRVRASVLTKLPPSIVTA